MDATSSSVSSDGSSMVNTNSFTAMEDFPGFAAGDHEAGVNMSDPFQGIFYHMMPLQDSTDIIFYNQAIFNNILTVLSKEFIFPCNETKKFQLRTYVDHRKCILSIDKTVMSVSASGPGHASWKGKVFKKLSENVFRAFVKENDSLLKIDVVNETLSTSQDSTQNQEDNGAIINDTVEEAEIQSPAGAEAKESEQVVDFTRLKDSPVMRQISALMDMISTLQGQITILTKNVNELVQQAAEQSMYRTVDQISISSPSMNHSAGSNVPQQEMPEYSNVGYTATTPITSERQFPDQATELPEPQTRQYSDVVRTSTPVDSVNDTPQRPRPAPRRTLHQNGPRPRPSPRPLPRAISSNQILLIGDSLISMVNPKGLRDNLITNGISGGNIEKITAQMKVYDISKFSHVIIYVGGNDASNRTDIEYFEEMYDKLIQYIKEANSRCKILLCNSCPRGDTSTAELNEIIKSLASHHGARLIELNKAFHNRQGFIIKSYYGTDRIHLSSSGVKRLLGTINREVTIVNNFDKCFYSHRQASRARKPRLSGRKSQAEYGNALSYCYKCGEDNHDTNNCRHRGQLKCHHCGFYGHKSGRCLQTI